MTELISEQLVSSANTSETLNGIRKTALFLVGLKDEMLIETLLSSMKPSTALKIKREIFSIKQIDEKQIREISFEFLKEAGGQKPAVSEKKTESTFCRKTFSNSASTFSDQAQNLPESQSGHFSSNPKENDIRNFDLSSNQNQEICQVQNSSLNQEDKQENLSSRSETFYRFDSAHTQTEDFPKNISMGKRRRRNHPFPEMTAENMSSPFISSINETEPEIHFDIRNRNFSGQEGGSAPLSAFQTSVSDQKRGNVLQNPQISGQTVPSEVPVPPHTDNQTPSRSTDLQSHFHFLKQGSNDCLAAFFRQVHPQMAAIALASFPIEKAGDILTLFPKKELTPVLRRILHLQTIDTDVLSDVEKLLKEQWIEFSKPEN